MGFPVSLLELDRARKRGHGQGFRQRRAAHEAVESMDGGLDVARQAARRVVVRRVVATLQAPARPVGLLQSRFGDDMHHE